VPSVWSGTLATDPAKLFDSPGRRAIFNYLTAGHAGAVILLLSGDHEQDEAARQLLRTELPNIASAITLPPRTDDGPQVQSELPLRIDFPIVEVARGPEEEFLVRQLLGSEDGLVNVTGPITFPVFGRGRALCSLTGKALRDRAELGRSLEFLCKACTCQAKELNPGVDLLMTGNWDIVFDAERGPMPRLAGPPDAELRTGAADPSSAESRSGPPAGYAAVDVETGPRERRRVPFLRPATIGAGLLVLITGFWAFRGRRPAPPPGP
jgi:hypothetical protein